MPRKIKKVVYQENLYSVFNRGDMWYVQYKDPASKKYLSAKSLKLRKSDGFSRLDAEKHAEEAIKNGVVENLIKNNANKDSIYFSGFTKG